MGQNIKVVYKLVVPNNVFLFSNLSLAVKCCQTWNKVDYKTVQRHFYIRGFFLGQGVKIIKENLNSCPNC